MKRIFSLSLAALLILSSLTGCGSKENGTTSKTPEEYTQAYQSAIESARDQELNEAIPVITSFDADLASLVLPMVGITEENTAAFAVALSPMNIKAYGVAAILPAEGKADELEASVQGFVDQQKQNFQQYLVDQYDIADSAKVETLEDGTILLVMCEDQDTVLESIKTALSA